MKQKLNVALLARALRIPFLTASILPFILGSILAKGKIHSMFFILGLIAVITTHLGSNLINDYADSQKGSDWKDRTFYGFFGGSKLIQEGLLSERFYFITSILCYTIAGFSVGILALLLKRMVILGYFLIILFLAWSYSEKPFQFAYRRMGEIAIFILFGPVLVMGGYYIQSLTFPSLDSFLMSLPSGFSIMAVLFVNEVPDFQEDTRSFKRNLVGLVGLKQAYFAYLSIVLLSYCSIWIAVCSGFLSKYAFCSLLLIGIPLYAGAIVRKEYANKQRLLVSSKLTILFHTLLHVVLILSLLVTAK